MADRPNTPVLDRVNVPADMKVLSDAELYQLATDVRNETISAVSETGGHLGAGLGVPRTRLSGTYPISVTRIRF